ncbi:MAG: hypothetical protein IJ767_06065 [Bacteroidaceae bacterium]|nr:hypothetical protein [Bacteroidaceae bacterium]
MKNVPKTIYLHFRDEKGKVLKKEEATWGEERLYPSDVEYQIVEVATKAPSPQKAQKHEGPRVTKSWGEIQQTLESLLVHRVTPEGGDEYRCHACRGWYNTVYPIAHARYCKSCYTAEEHRRRREKEEGGRDEGSN